MSDVFNRQLTVRLQDDDLLDLDAIASVMRGKKEHAGSIVTRTDALRMAIARGIDIIKTEEKITPAMRAQIAGGKRDTKWQAHDAARVARKKK